jgi:hypothetical protein
VLCAVLMSSPTHAQTSACGMYSGFKGTVYGMRGVIATNVSVDFLAGVYSGHDVQAGYNFRADVINVHCDNGILQFNLVNTMPGPNDGPCTLNVEQNDHAVGACDLPSGGPHTWSGDMIRVH